MSLIEISEMAYYSIGQDYSSSVLRIILVLIWYVGIFEVPNNNRRRKNKLLYCNIDTTFCCLYDSILIARLAEKSFAYE